MNTRDNELIIVRMVNAPREKVWRAFREPAALRQWWGLPKGAAMPTCRVDFRVGGMLHFEVEHDGATLWFKSLYREIVEGEWLVLEQHKSDAAGNECDSADWPPSTITIRFEDANGKTKLTITHAGMASALHTIGQYQEGWSQSLDRLDESLARG